SVISEIFCQNFCALKPRHCKIFLLFCRLLMRLPAPSDHCYFYFYCFFAVSPCSAWLPYIRLATRQSRTSLPRVFKTHSEFRDGCENTTPRNPARGQAWKWQRTGQNPFIRQCLSACILKKGGVRLKRNCTDKTPP